MFVEFVILLEPHLKYLQRSHQKDISDNAVYYKNPDSEVQEGFDVIGLSEDIEKENADPL